jgi:hypothetical protein
MPVLPHDPAKPVSTQDELEKLLLDGLGSGVAQPMTEDDWQDLRQLALAKIDLRKSG